MCTKYYLQPAPCPSCGHIHPPTYLGESSEGWCFLLRVHPEEGIDSLSDLINWIADEIRLNNARIMDEYEEEYSLLGFLDIVTKRSNPKIINMGWAKSFDHYKWYKNEADFHQHNGSERGPSGLLRHRIGSGYCIGHGPGTWDFTVGEFSL